MIIDTTQPTIISNHKEIMWDSASFGFAEKCYGYEYLVLSDDKESTGYPIEEIGWHWLSDWDSDKAYLIDAAGIIWQRDNNIFRRYCRRAALAYVEAFFGCSEMTSAIAANMHDRWLKKYDN